MAGHSKWANIKHRKSAQDSKRGRAFTKVVKDIMVAAKIGGPDPDANPRLRLAIAKAKAVSLPRDNLERAIAKGAGTLEGENVDEVRYEGYGPGGVAILIESLTDNRNRTAAEVRHAFTRRGQSLGTSGAAAHAFNRVGQVTVVAEGTDEDALMMAAMEHGADDLLQDFDAEAEADVFMVTCDVADLEGLREGLETAGFSVSGYGLHWVPTVTVPLQGEDAEKLLDLIDFLEELDDVQSVFANHELSDEELDRIAGDS
jgi:YebC/PmpR family DNA-binding regulatory protein